MEENQKKPEVYSLPFVVYSSYKPLMHVLLLFTVFLFAGAWFIPVDDLGGILFKILSVCLSLFLAYTWIYMGVAKKAYVKLDEDGISQKTLFALKKIKWTDIIDVRTYCVNNNPFIGIVSKEKLKKRKDNYLAFLSNAFGGGYSFSISLKQFSKADPEKLYSTIFYTAQEKWKEHGGDECEDDVSDEVDDNNDEKVSGTNSGSNLLNALIKALIVSFVVGVIYGLSIYTFKVNFLVIPILGMMGILYAYMRGYEEKRFNIIIRVLLGFICAFQFFVAQQVGTLMINSIGGQDVLRVISDCTADMVAHPGEHIRFYSYSIICFLTGTFWGYSSKTTRSIRKLFMHKQNGFCIKKEKRYVSIYLIDYAKYDKYEEKAAFRINPNVCLIEKDKKNILAFYIPEELIKDLNIDASVLHKMDSDERIYYKLDLGGNAEPQPYGYTSILILNQNRQIEVIQMEID